MCPGATLRAIYRAPLPLAAVPFALAIATAPLALAAAAIALALAAAPPPTTTVVLTLTASGSGSDYSSSLQSELQQKIAAAAGVDKSFVTISVAAASVIITANIAVPASSAAITVQASLASTLGTAAAASTALGVTVEAVPTVTIASPPLPPGLPPPGLPRRRRWRLKVASTRASSQPWLSARSPGSAARAWHFTWAASVPSVWSLKRSCYICDPRGTPSVLECAVPPTRVAECYFIWENVN